MAPLKSKHTTMRTQICVSLWIVLLLIGMPPRPAWATLVPLTADSFLLDRAINVLRFLIEDELKDKRDAKEVAEAILQAQRACLAEGLVTIDPEVLELTVRTNEKAIECLKLANFEEVLRCFQNVTAVPKKNLEVVANSMKRCLTDDVFDSYLVLSSLGKSRK